LVPRVCGTSQMMLCWGTSSRSLPTLPARVEDATHVW
jgi:hypothetical protein